MRPSCSTHSCTMRSTSAATVTSATIGAVRPPMRADLARRALQHLAAARHEGDVRAFGRQRQRDRFADAARCAGDERDLALEFEVHR